MAKTYFRLDTIKVQATKNGKIYSGALETPTEIPNGMLVYLGDYKAGEKEVRVLKTPTAELITNEIPVIVAVPELNYSQNLKTDSALGIFRNKEGKVLRVLNLEGRDEISLSQDFFDLTGKGNGKIEVNDMFAIQSNLVAGTQLKYSATVPAKASNKVYLKVTGIVKSHTPVFVSGDGQLFPQAYDMVDCEIIVQ